MKLFGLTGGVGMGKSTVDQMLRNRGVSVIDTDRLARQIVEPGEPALLEIQRAFGDEIISPSGELRRDELARHVFADPQVRQKLEAILHPRIRELWKKQVDLWRADKRPVACVVIPLLFETHAEGEFDVTICVACSVATQHRRLLERGWTEHQIAQRLAAQWPIEQKMTKATHVIWTEGDLDSVAEQLKRIVA